MHNHFPRKALIPLAGLGTRMFPASKTVKKELFPVITPEGLCKSLLQCSLEEISAAGIPEIGLIIRPGDEAVFAPLFQPVSATVRRGLPDWARQEEEKLLALGEKITFITQPSPEGFGHAVYCAREWVGQDSFLLLLSDHIYAAHGPQSCTEQLLSAFQRHGGQSILSLYPVQEAQVRHYGTATGQPTADPSCLRLQAFVEKPSPEYAREHLSAPNLPAGQYLCVYGQYILTAEIFTLLGEEIAAGRRVRGEFQLTPSLSQLVQAGRMLGYLVQGEHYDTGQPWEYLHSLQAYAKK
ncbi:MAG: UTP--glucose-1-phosphate uridylyltransferase [Lentisphaerae bacterium]|nr:UTP--glucose-1-phosphate uridylyltransferase [Lentisphaerota bacterium]